jgi:DNA-binding IclR family transcriptional regulator
MGTLNPAFAKQPPTAQSGAASPAENAIDAPAPLYRDLTQKTASAPSLERGLAILELVARHPNGLTLSQLVRQMGLPKSSLHSLLLTFERAGYLNRIEPNGQYICGAKFIRVAMLAFDNALLRQKANPILVKLMRATGLTVHLATLWRAEVVLIARVSPASGRRVATWIGKRVDAHCTSVGKCLIAALPQDELIALVRDRGLFRHNDNTITSLTRLNEELERVRRASYALDEEEEEVGFCCVGAPVIDSACRVVAAVSVSGETERVSASDRRKLISQVQSTAAELSKLFCFHPERA